MLIARNTPRLLKPISKSQWINEGIKTYFRLRARLNDGHICWTGWYEDRDDADAVLFAITTGSIKSEPQLWDLSTPHWYPGLGEIESYDFATVTFITSPTGSNQTYNVPSDWNNSNNSIECLGAGGSGAALRHGLTGIRYASGGGGGGYGVYTNLTLTAGGTATYQIGTGGTAVTSTVQGTGISGNAGGDTWFNGTTYSGASVGGVGGSNGNWSITTSVNGGTGGGGKGTSSNSGGRGGDITGTGGFRCMTGGGGAAGGSGAGGNGVDISATAAAASAGGTGDNGAGGAGGAGVFNGATGNNGGNGTEWSASYGSGGGGGGVSASNQGATVAGSGGTYGGGGGAGGCISFNATSGAGTNGIIVITYEPSAAATLILTNIPMLGM